MTLTSVIRLGRLWAALVVLVVLIGCGSAAPSGGTSTPEPIVPTRTPQAADQPPTATPQPSPTAAPPTAAALPALTAAQATAIAPIGVAGAREHVPPVLDLGLRFAQFTFWNVWDEPPDAPGVTTWQNVRFGLVPEEEQWPANREVVERTLAAHPGSFWLIANEPDVQWQDNLTAEEYAERYHELYTFIKERDPSARVGAGGIALPTPLRMAYLDAVLATYQERFGEPLPADLWSIHLFVLREEADSWGIGIPPGMDATAGELYGIEDHGDFELAKGYVESFRAWMAANGYGDKPLAVTEFGILLPEDYGFPPEFVQAYLIESYDYFRTATGENGLASDGGRLVQYAFWYSLYDPSAYMTGNLYDGAGGGLTPLGEVFKTYVQGLLE